jgi:hypothetical protein
MNEPDTWVVNVSGVPLLQLQRRQAHDESIGDTSAVSAAPVPIAHRAQQLGTGAAAPVPCTIATSSTAALQPDKQLQVQHCGT